jgi:hypothetical protein
MKRIRTVTVAVAAAFPSFAASATRAAIGGPRMRRTLTWLLLSLSLAVLPRLASAIFASPVQAGCYIAAANDCRIHVDPFTVNIASATKLAHVRLVAINTGTGIQTVVYDWRSDQSNPVPSIGTTYSPSIPNLDIGVGCGKTFELSLQGRDTGDANDFNLGLTNAFTCPNTLP